MPALAPRAKPTVPRRSLLDRLIRGDRLWALRFGNGVFGDPTDLVFSAGIENETHGLLGIIEPASG